VRTRARSLTVRDPYLRSAVRFTMTPARDRSAHPSRRRGGARAAARTAVPLRDPAGHRALPRTRRGRRPRDRHVVPHDRLRDAHAGPLRQTPPPRPRPGPRPSTPDVGRRVRAGPRLRGRLAVTPPRGLRFGEPNRGCHWVFWCHRVPAVWRAPFGTIRRGLSRAIWRRAFFPPVQPRSRTQNAVRRACVIPHAACARPTSPVTCPMVHLPGVGSRRRRPPETPARHPSVGPIVLDLNWGRPFFRSDVPLARGGRALGPCVFRHRAKKRGPIATSGPSQNWPLRMGHFPAERHPTGRVPRVLPHQGCAIAQCFIVTRPVHHLHRPLPWPSPGQWTAPW
jgi:hypothetical protein